jgi:hypothetical protein
LNVVPDVSHSGNSVAMFSAPNASMIFSYASAAICLGSGRVMRTASGQLRSTTTFGPTTAAGARSFATTAPSAGTPFVVPGTNVAWSARYAASSAASDASVAAPVGSADDVTVTEPSTVTGPEPSEIVTEPVTGTGFPPPTSVPPTCSFAVVHSRPPATCTGTYCPSAARSAGVAR